MIPEINQPVVFDMEFDEWMPGSPIAPNAVRFTPQELTPEEKAQALKNIGAVPSDGDSLLVGWDTENEIGIGAASVEKNEDGHITAGRLDFYTTDNDQPVVLGGLSPGVYDSDAATVSQVKAGNIYYTTERKAFEFSEKNSEGETITKSQEIYHLYDSLAKQYNRYELDENGDFVLDEKGDKKPLDIRVKKIEYKIDDSFSNYVYEITTGDYPYGAYSESYGDDSKRINKPKYLLLGSIHGTERQTTLSTYRFIRDVLSGHNVPHSFREGTIISVMPVGTPSAFDAFTRKNGDGVDINRNFNSDNPAKETQAIMNWLADNQDADLFIDFHNSGVLNEKVVVLGLPDNSITDTAKKVALRGLDRVIPFWRGVMKYPDKIEAENAKNEIGYWPVIYAYSAFIEIAGAALTYAQEVFGISSIAIEAASFAGNRSEWLGDEEKGIISNQQNYSSNGIIEAISMGAEALGNILIEFYAQSSEVTMMSNIDSKLEALVKSARFRVESGTITIPPEKEIIVTDSPGYVVYGVECSKGVKFFDFHACIDTKNEILASGSTTKAQFVISVFGNYFTPDITDLANDQAGFGQTLQNYVYNGKDYGWISRPATFKKVDPSEGYGFAFRAPALKAGTYHWTAYYWD